MIPNVELLDEDQLKTLEAFIARRCDDVYEASVVGLWKTNKHIYADIQYKHLSPDYVTSKEKRYYRPATTHIHMSGREVHTKSRWKLVD